MTLSTMHTQKLQPIMRHWRIIFVLWLFLTILSSAFGMSSIIISPLHPLYFVLIAILPSTIFLLISIITSHSIFTQLFIWLKNAIFKDDITHKTPTKLPLRYIVQLISNCTWITILLTGITVLFFKFTFQHFDFYLGNTFTESKNITEKIIHILNLLPEGLGLVSFDDQLITASFATQNLDDTSRSMWAKWIIIMIFFYGLLPRLIVLTYYGIRSLLYSPPKPIITTQTHILDHATEKPLVIRAPKTRVFGKGSLQVALDITEQISLNPDVIKLNDIESFQQFELKHKAEPLKNIDIFLDGNLMPDRGLLRRLIRLLNLSEKASVHIMTDNPHQKSMWQQHLSTILVEGELANYDTQ